MGLDMYLDRRVYIGNKYREPNQRLRLIYPASQKDAAFEVPANSIKTEKIKEITEEIGYWRKANAIHQWFVENVQDGSDDCKDYYVSEEQIQKLLDLCEKVKAASKLVDGEIQNGTTNGQPNMVPGKYIENPTVAQELLPTTEGFFFGSTDYNEYYLQDITDTIEICKQALESTKNGGSLYYQSSW